MNAGVLSEADKREAFDGRELSIRLLFAPIMRIRQALRE